MRCENIWRYLPLYLDSELGIEKAQEIVRHLEQCISCRERMEGEQRLEGAIAGTLAKIAAPDRDIWQRAMARSVGGRSRWLRWSAIAAVALLLLALGAVFALRPRGEPDLSRAMAANHTKYLSGSLPPSVETSAPDQLEAYFGGKMSFPTSLGRPSGDTAFVGGRSCYLDRSPCAHVTAHVGQVAVSVFLIDESQLSAFPEAASRMEGGMFRCRNGPFNLIAYRDRGRIVCAIGELNPERLEAAVRQLTGSP